MKKHDDFHVTPTVLFLSPHEVVPSPPRFCLHERDEHFMTYSFAV
jgi:hypothetical protein